MFDTVVFRQKLDHLRRRLPPAEEAGHGFLNDAVLAIQEIELLRIENERAWADADQVAKRDFAARALQAIVMMVGIREEEGKLVPAFETKHTYAEKLAMVRTLASDYAQVMLEDDRKNRKEKPL